MGKRIDLTGQVFGRLTVIGDAGRSKYGAVMWECLCECGNKRRVLSSSLIRGKVKSCGCLYCYTLAYKDSEGIYVKECHECYKVKHIDEFGQDKYSKDGLKNKCKECVRKYDAKRWAIPKIREKGQKLNKKYRQEFRQGIEYKKKHRKRESERRELPGMRELLREKARIYNKSDQCKAVRKKHINDADDFYIRRRIYDSYYLRGMKIKPKDIPQELIDLWRERLIEKRKVKNATK